jgi:Mg-chelatase subunit ChlD
MLMAILLPVLLIVSGFAINLSYMELARTDLQIASDAASRAACRTFGFTKDKQAAINAAKNAATRNPVVGKVLSLREQDIVFGTSRRASSSTKFVFTQSNDKINSVKVDFLSAASGSVQLPIRIGVNDPNFAVAQQAISTQSDVDIVLVLDRSGSMAFATDEIASPTVPPKNAPIGWEFGFPVPPKARWTDAINATNSFLASLAAGPQEVFVGLASYSDYSTIDVNLTTNYGDIAAALNYYSNPFNEGGTNIGDGIYSGMTNLKHSNNRRSQAIPVLIVLTDGIHNWGPDPIDAARDAANSNVIIYTITFSQEADQPAMAQIANIGKGKHYHATDVTTLQQAFDEIAGDLPVLLTK